MLLTCQIPVACTTKSDPSESNAPFTSEVLSSIFNLKYDLWANVKSTDECTSHTIICDVFAAIWAIAKGLARLHLQRIFRRNWLLFAFYILIKLKRNGITESIDYPEESRFSVAEAVCHFANSKFPRNNCHNTSTLSNDHFPKIQFVDKIPSWMHLLIFKWIIKRWNIANLMHLFCHTFQLSNA